jgi:hypothetical protein
MKDESFIAFFYLCTLILKYNVSLNVKNEKVIDVFLYRFPFWCL